ncbi:MAG: DUF151 domain-containing protein [Chitinophagales bacterium]|nr:DUF151 domain-containing protein [Chitinophagales bacterium]
MSDSPKIALEIIALSPNVAQNHSYALILGEIDGERRLPIMIGAFEAQAIAVALEKITPSRPLTHDLMKNMMSLFEITLKEVIIDNMQDKVFYSKLVCELNGRSLEIDSRTSDAIAMAIRYECPIYTFDRILDQTGFSLDTKEGPEGKRVKKSDSTDGVSTTGSSSDSNSKYTLAQLQERLAQYLEDEEYEKAAQIRDEISRREGKK